MRTVKLSYVRRLARYTADTHHGCCCLLDGFSVQTTEDEKAAEEDIRSDLAN